MSPKRILVDTIKPNWDKNRIRLKYQPEAADNSPAPTARFANNDQNPIAWTKSIRRSLLHF